MSDSERKAANDTAAKPHPAAAEEHPEGLAAAEAAAQAAAYSGEDEAEEVVEESPGPIAGEATSPIVEGEIPIGGPNDRVSELEAQVAELKDQLLRALAETENVRRRSQRDRSDLQKFAAAPVVKDLLGVADNLARALESVKPEALAEDGALQSLVEGVQMTQRELAQVLERHHIVEIEALGQKMDPHVHEAMFEVPDPSQPTGTVVQVVQPGYMLHDRLLRPARVGVAKGGPAQAPQGGGDSPEPGSHLDTEA